MKQKADRILKAKESMELNRMLLKQRQDESRRKEEEETRKCEEELARQNRIRVARVDLEIKLAEKGNLACTSLLVEQDMYLILLRFILSMSLYSEFG
jgi:hypothetical protein